MRLSNLFSRCRRRRRISLRSAADAGCPVATHRVANRPLACCRNAGLTIRDLSTFMGNLRLILIALVAVVGILAGASVSAGAPHFDVQEVVSQASGSFALATSAVPEHSGDHAHDTLCLPPLPLRRNEASPGRNWLAMIPTMFRTAIGSLFDRPPRDTVCIFEALASRSLIANGRPTANQMKPRSPATRDFVVMQLPLQPAAQQATPARDHHLCA